MIGALFRVYSYLYHLVLALFLLGIGLVGLESQTLKLGMLPWKGRTLVYSLIGFSVIGLLSIMLAWLGKMRPLFFLYSMTVFVMMLRGYFLGGYLFSGKSEFRMAIYLTVGALIAIIGAWSQFRKKARNKRS